MRLAALAMCSAAFVYFAALSRPSSLSRIGRRLPHKLFMATMPHLRFCACSLSACFMAQLSNLYALSRLRMASLTGSWNPWQPQGQGLSVSLLQLTAQASTQLHGVFIGVPFSLVLLSHTPLFSIFVRHAARICDGFARFPLWFFLSDIGL
jgi:hypothetical protein